MVTFLGSLVQFCCGEGGTLQNISLACVGSTCSVHLFEPVVTLEEENLKWPGLLGQGCWGDGHINGKQHGKGPEGFPHPNSSFPPWQVQCCAPPPSRLGTGDQSGLEDPLWLFRDYVSETPRGTVLEFSQEGH